MTLEMKYQEKINEGKHENAIETAIAMFQNGIPFETIEKCVRLLSNKELKEIQTRVQNEDNIKP